MVYKKSGSESASPWLKRRAWPTSHAKQPIAGYGAIREKDGMASGTIETPGGGGWGPPARS